MTGPALFLGVDGGGTKTEFVCMDEAGHVVARSVTGTTYHPQVGIDGAALLLGEGVSAVCRQLAIGPDRLSFAFFGLPGYGEDRVADPELHARCGALLGHARYDCGNDMVCGWAGSLACQDGINIVAGTGSIGYGQRQGRGLRAGGWSEIFSDEGSAYWIAVRGLNAFSRMSDGRLERGPLHAMLTEALNLRVDLDLCARIAGDGGMTRDQIAAMAPIVSAAAAVGDRAAGNILEEAARELFDIAVALRNGLGFGETERAPLSWSGGVLASEPRVRDALVSHITVGGAFEVVEPRHPPAYGAALYARQLASA